MSIPLSTRKESFIELGKRISNVLNKTEVDKLTYGEASLYRAITDAANHNPWFTEENCRYALSGLANMLKRDKFEKWVSSYNISEVSNNPKTIAVIMAGNIPAVGFHDFLCVLISGNIFLGKLASQDKIIPKAIADLLIEINNDLKDYILFEDNIIKNFDAIIATGSNNSSRYFDYYFGKYPHIIRKSRSSIAVLSGKETDEELKPLGEDIFRYFGLGCRNVSQIMFPEGFDIKRIFPLLENWAHLGNHHKYANNYDYNKSIFLINRVEHLDTGFALYKPDSSLMSHISVVNFHAYKNIADLELYIKQESDNLQCISCNFSLETETVSVVPLGTTQNPELWDYADGIDTIKFITNLVINQ
jgi:hypothetical protein